MHYSVLTAVTLSKEITIPPEEDKQIRADLKTARAMLKKEPDSHELQWTIAELEHSLNPLENVAERLVFEVMDPYGMETENPKRLAFFPHEETDESDYATETRDCVRLPDGSIVFRYDPRFSKHYEIFEGKVYRKEFGPLRHRKRTRKAKKFLPLPDYPLKKLYPTFQKYMEQYFGCVYNEEAQAYGHYGNPDAFWDWYEVGGRWQECFLVKEDCPIAVRGMQGVLCGPGKTAPEGYCWVAGARKCDIAWEQMKKNFNEEIIWGLRQFQSWYLAGKVPEAWRGIALVTSDGVYLHRWLVYRANETEEQNLCRASQLAKARYFVNPYAFIGSDGWKDIEPFESDAQDGAADMQWNQMVQDFIDGLPEEALLVSVDCHN